MASTTDPPVDRATAVRGAAGGVAAYLLGYLLTYAWRAPAVEESLRGVNFVAELFGGETVPTWKAVGWLFYNAHVVATRVPALGGGDRMVNFVSQSDDGTFVLLYALVPVLLVLAGAAVARYGNAERPGSGAAAGAAVIVGYLPLAVVGAFAFAHTFGGDLRVAPDLVTAVALAGVVYPAFFGAIGGALWSWLSASRGS
jgi:hypothetical protein